MFEIKRTLSNRDVCLMRSATVKNVHIDTLLWCNQSILMAVVALGVKTTVYNGVFSVFSAFSVTNFFCTTDVSASCSGNDASGKEIYHRVNHAQKHGREVFTQKSIAFEPIRKRTGNCYTYYLDYRSGHFQICSHIKEKAKSVL